MKIKPSTGLPDTMEKFHTHYRTSNLAIQGNGTHCPKKDTACKYPKASP